MNNTKSISSSSVSGLELAVDSHTSVVPMLMGVSSGCVDNSDTGQPRHSIFDLFKSFEFCFWLFVILPCFVYCSVFAISSFGLAGIFLIFVGSLVVASILSLCDFIS